MYIYFLLHHNHFLSSTIDKIDKTLTKLLDLTWIF